VIRASGTRVGNGSLCCIDGRIDVADGAVAQTADCWIIFFTSDVRVHFAQQLKRFVQATRTIGGVVYTHVIVNILAVIDRSPLDLANRSIDLYDRHIFLTAYGGITRTMLKHPAGGAQITQRMQVGWVTTRQICIRRERREKKQ
jgi:hypothetical protein